MRYQSEALARWALHARDRKVRVRWYSEDIGAIAVETGGEWIEVPAVFDRFDGVRAETWRAAARQLRAQSRHGASFDQDAIFDAIAAIDAINGDAMRRIGLVTDDWSQERVDREEENFFISIDWHGPRREARPRSEATGFGEEIAAYGPVDPVAAAYPEPPAPAEPPVPDTGQQDGDGSGWEIEDGA